MKKPILLLLISCLILLCQSKFNLSHSRVNKEVGSDEDVSIAPKSIVTIADLVVSESIGNAYITVSLSQTSSRSIKIYYETIEGTAKVSKDYKYDNGIISIAPGKLSAQIIVRIVKDKLVEETEYFDVKLKLIEDQDHASLGDNRGRITIEDALHTSYIELNNLVVVYKNTNYGSIPDDFISRLQPALDEASLFYWRHSHMGLNIKWTIHVIEENLFRVRENDYIYPHEVDADIRSRGFKEGSFDAVLAVAVHSGAYAWGVNNILGRGGFFQVPWWEDKWLFPWFIVHEFHHIVDAMFLFSGHPEYPHNHPGAARALGEYLPHSGTDWDLNAEILQFWERTDWFDLINNGNWGSIKTSIDSDADLIPDKDTNVPLDELRFKSESSKKDTDHDGVPDLTETMAGIFTLGNPVHYDSDRDHIRDSKDTEPIYPFNTTVPNTLHLSLEQDLREWPKAGKYFFDKADGTSSALHLAYSEDQLFVGVKIPASLSRLQLIVDANNDGLYHGNDNIEIWLNGNTIETVNHLNAAAVPVGDHSDMIISPLPAEGFSGVSKVSSDESYYQLIIPKLSQYGLDLTPREKIGVFINLIGYGTLLELNDFLTVTIGKELKDVPIVQNNKTIITADEKYLNPLNLHTSAFPNPSTEFFNLKVTGGNQPINLIITDALGREVDRRTGLAAHATLQVGNNFKPGVYYAEVVQGNQRTVVKLIKF